MQSARESFVREHTSARAWHLTSKNLSIPKLFINTLYVEELPSTKLCNLNTLINTINDCIEKFEILKSDLVDLKEMKEQLYEE